MRIFILLMVCFLAGCTAAPVVQEVRVPVAVSCIKKADLPARPDYQTYVLPDNANDADVLIALVSDWARSRPYESALEAITRGCAGE